MWPFQVRSLTDNQKLIMKETLILLFDHVNHQIHKDPIFLLWNFTTMTNGRNIWITSNDICKHIPKSTCAFRVENLNT